MTDPQPAQATAPAPRMIAGRYALLAELGRGGMGVVWRAEDRVIGRQVAIKELRLPDGAEETVFSERVLREVRTGGKLNDPAVVTVYDVVTDHGGTFIVMELVEAPTLADLVRGHGPLPPQQVASIGQQVLTALRAAHDAGIVHRDVKPGNIMVAPNGRVKLTDFGIAQAVDDPRLTTSGMIIGSPAFMAPERVAGKEAVPASDLWSLGATLFYAAEGLHAFERPSTAATLHAIMNEVPYLTRSQGPLASVILGLLIASPDARISAAQASHLLAMAAGRQYAAPTVAASTPPGGYTLAWPGSGPVPAPARRRTPLWATLSVLAAVVLLGGGFLLGAKIAAPAQDPNLMPTETYGAAGNVPGITTVSGSYSCTKTQLENTTEDSNDWVDCKELHYTEFYDNLSLFGSSYSDSKQKAAYPPRLNAMAESFCASAFYSDVVPNRDGYHFRALVPSKQAWDTQNAGSSSDQPVRTVYCVLSKADQTAYTGGVAKTLY